MHPVFILILALVLVGAVLIKPIASALKKQKLKQDPEDFIGEEVLVIRTVTDALPPIGRVVLSGEGFPAVCRGGNSISADEIAVITSVDGGIFVVEPIVDPDKTLEEPLGV